MIKSVPFIEGYCFGANKNLIQNLTIDSIYGYGIDVEIGYKANVSGLQCCVYNNVCIKHEYGKSYSDNEATEEYKQLLHTNPELLQYLRFLDIARPVL